MYPDDLSKFRSMNQMQGIYGPTNVGSNDITDRPAPELYSGGADSGNTGAISPDVQSAMQQIYKSLDPKTTIKDLYEHMVQNPPTRTEPSMMRKIGGALAGLGNVGPAAYDHGAALGFAGDPNKVMQTADAFTNAPYYQQAAAYKGRLDELQKGAAEEGKSNTDKRMFAYQEAGRRIGTQNANTKITDEKRKEVSDQQRNDRMNRFADIKQLLVTRPDYTPVVDKDGKLILINKHNSSDIVPTDIEKMSDLEKLQLGIQGRESVANIQGDTRKAVAGIQSQTSKENTNNKIDATRAGKVGKTDQSLMSPSQKNMQQYINAREYVNQNPDAGKYVTLNDQNKSFKLNLPPGFLGMGKGDEAEFHKAYQAIYGTDKLESSKPVPSTGPVPVSTLPPRVPSSSVATPKTRTPAPKTVPSTSTGASIKPTYDTTTLPPREKRKKGDTFILTEGKAKGKVGTWNGQGWVVQ